MKRIKAIILFIVFLFFGNYSLLAQNKVLDSLNLALKNSRNDIERIKTLVQLGNTCEVDDNLKYAKPLINLADKLLLTAKDSLTVRNCIRARYEGVNFAAFYYRTKEGLSSAKMMQVYAEHLEVCKKYKDGIGIVDVLIDMTDVYDNNGELMKKLERLQEGYSLMKEMKYKKGEAKFLLQLAFFYSDFNDTTHAISYIRKVEALEAEIGDSTRISKGYYLKARFLNDIKHYEQSIVYFKKAEKRYKLIKDTSQLLDIYYQMAGVYQSKKDLDSALTYYHICSDLAKQYHHNFQYTYAALVGVGDIYSLQKKYNEAISIHQQVYELAIKINSPVAILFTSKHLLTDYYLMKDLKKAKPQADRSLALAYQIENVQDIFECEKFVYRIDSAAGDFKDAFAHYQKYLLLKNKLNNELVRKAATQERFQNELSQQQLKAKSELEKNEAINEKEKQKQRNIIYSISAVLFLVLLLVVFVYRSYKQKQRSNLELAQKNLEIEEKNKDILDSIRYAKRIQTSLLPTHKYIDRVLNEKDKI
ncbi:MAG: tetratricopeptide repeat protein [Bacteroidetes bacterium]|nr:tetratricopeptide repeat protein [Bacteroidota bacterium]